MAGDQGLSIGSAQQAGGGARGAPYASAQGTSPIVAAACASPFFEQDKAGGQRNLFQLPLTLFIITNMKGRERDGVKRTGSLWGLIYLSQAAVGRASFLFVSDVGN